MKFFIVAALASVAVANPAMVYHAGTPFVGSHIPVAGSPIVGSTFGVPVVSKVETPAETYLRQKELKEKNIEINEAVKVEDTKVQTYNLFTGEKKEQERPAITYNTASALPINHYNWAGMPFTSGVVPVVNKVVKPATYHQKNGEVESTVFKREAEAEADPEAFLGLPYTTGFYNPIAYNTAIKPVVYSNAAIKPVVYNTAAAFVPAVKANDFTVPNRLAPFANDAANPLNFYANKGMYVAKSAGATHIAKREAEGEAESFYNLYNAAGLYNTAAINPVVYNSGLVKPAVYTSGLVKPVVYNSGLVKPAVYTSGLVKPAVYTTSAYKYVL